MKISNINKRRTLGLLKQNKRFDGRAPFDSREIIIESGVSNNAEGSVRVKIGKTDVIVGVKMDTQEPYSDHEDEGTMVTSMEFSPMAGDRYEPGPPKMNAIEIARVVDRGVRESGFIDWKKLCIKKGEEVWNIFIDIYCINDDGNVMDASAIGAIVALKTARFPVYDKKEKKVKFGEFSKDPLPLTENIPFSITFYKIGDEMLVDPNRDEEDASEGRITIAISCPKKDKIINAMQKGGIGDFSFKDMEKIIETSEKIYNKLFPCLK